MARQLTTTKAIDDIFKMSADYKNSTEEVNDKMFKIFRGLTHNLAEDIKMLTPKERIELATKMMPHFSRFFESGELLKKTDEEQQKVMDMFNDRKEV